MAGRAVAAAALFLVVYSNEAIKVRTSLLKRRSFAKVDLEAARAARKHQNRIKKEAEVMASMNTSMAYDLFKKAANQSAPQEQHLVNLVDAKMKHGKVTATREAVDKGRDVLNGIMDEIIKKKELEIVRCDEFEHKQLTILKELEQDIAYVNSEATAARSEILNSQAVIQFNEEVKLPQDRRMLDEHNAQCEQELRAFRRQYYLVANDTEVMGTIVGMLCDDHATTGTEQPGGAVFLQTDAGFKTATVVKCTSCMSGREHAFSRNDRVRPLVAQLQSNEAKQYIRQQLLDSFHEHESKHPERVQRVALTQKERLHEVPGFELQGLPDFPAEMEAGACNEMLSGTNGSLYRGCRRETVEGIPCQRWSKQSPNSHTYTDQIQKQEDLTDNFCRNPYSEKKTIWCFTEWGDQGWGYCEPKALVRAPLPATKHVCVETGICKLSDGSCRDLTIRLMAKYAEFKDQKDYLKDQIEKTEAVCHEIRTNYEYTIRASETVITEQNVALGVSTEKMTTNLQQSELSNQQHFDLNMEYHMEMSKCCANRNMMTGDICALKKIRGELYRIDNYEPRFSDCEVTEWVDEECSAECAGGTQKRTRTVLIFPVNGTQCPPMRMDRACNTIGCPVDCKLDDWSSWSECTALCNGGVRSRSRDRLIEPDNDGEPCGEQTETVSCNVNACTSDCTLHDWSEWGLCSKACETGHQTRTRSVKTEPVGQGTCKGPEDATRMEFKKCNEFDCDRIIDNPDRSLLQCTSMIDLVMLVDGSASLGEYGWNMFKRATEQIISTLQGNSSGVNAAVMVFGGPMSVPDLDACTSNSPDSSPDIVNQCGMHWIQHLTTDISVVQQQTNNMDWADATTLTSMALIEAKGELVNGRPDATSVVVVITDGHPMSPIRTESAALALKDSARLIWIPVGVEGSIDETFDLWASKPAEDNVVRVETLAEMATPYMLNEMVATICPSVQ